MRIFVQVAEAIAVLFPDLQTLGLSVPAFFSLYCCAITLGLPGSRDAGSDLPISLVFGYVVAVAFNIVSAMTHPARPRPFFLSQLEPSVEKWPQKSSADAGKARSLREGAVMGQETDLFEKVRG